MATCPFHDNCTNYVPPDGNVNSRLCILGEAPGIEEIAEGRPFVGPAGKLLWTELAVHGITRESVFVYNAVPCLGKEIHTPTVGEINTFRDHILKTLVALPNVDTVLVLGAVAARSLGLVRTNKLSTILNSRQTVVLPDGRRVTAIVTYHPAAILHSMRRGIQEMFRVGLKMLADHLSGAVSSVDWYPGHVPVQTTDDLDRMVAVAKESGALALDIETAGDLWHGGTWVCCGFYFPGSSDTVFSIYRDAVPQDRLAQAVRYIFDTVPVRVGHNVGYDCLVLQKHGLLGRHQWATDDTLVMAHLLHPEMSGSLDLKSLGQIVFNIEAYWQRQVGNARVIDLVRKNSLAVDKDVLFEYNGRDCVLAWRLYSHMLPQLQGDRQLWLLYTQVLRPTARILGDIQWNGLLIDRDTAERLIQQWTHEAASLEAQMNDLIGESINWNSPKQVQTILYGKLNLPTRVMTDTGVPSTSQEVLLSLLGTHPLVDLLVRYRDVTKAVTMVKSLLDGVSDDGRIHAAFNLAGTVSGRSSSRPNVQNLERGPGIRDIVVAPPGYLLVEADLSQIELRWMAHLYREERLDQALRLGADIHRQTASLAFAKPPDQVTKEERTAGKTANFSLGYGAGARKLAVILRRMGGIRSETARQLLESAGVKCREDDDPVLVLAYKLYNAFHQQFPGVKQAHSRIAHELERNGSVRSAFGRYWRGAVNAAAIREAANFVVQSSAADTLWLCLVNAAQLAEEYGARIVNVVHDSILAEVPEQRAHEFAQALLQIMRHPDFGRCNVTPIPVDAEVKIGRSWGSLQPVSFDGSDHAQEGTQEDDDSDFDEFLLFEADYDQRPVVAAVSDIPLQNRAVAAEEDMPVYEYAVKYVNRGWSVIPVEPATKMPAIEWKDYQTKLATPPELQGWFLSNRIFNIGIVTGKVSGLVVVDVEQSGLQTARELGLESPVAAMTGGGGLHYYFRYPDGLETVKNAVKLWPGIDIRGDGGFVVAPPSIHASGGRYRWLSPPWDITLPDLPAIVLDRIRPVETVAFPDSVPAVLLGQKILPDDTRHKIVQLLEPYWRPGTRHNLGLAITGLMAKRGYRWEDVEKIVTMLVANTGDSEDNDRFRILQDTYHKVASGNGHVAGYQLLVSLTDQDVAKEIISLVGSYRRVAGVEACSLAEFAEELAIEPDWVVQGLLPMGGLAQLAGHPGCGKTTLAFQLAVSVASGSVFLEEWPTKPRRVLYLQADNPITMMRELSKEMLRRLPQGGHDVILANIQDPIRIDTEEGFEVVKELCTVYTPELVILDTIRDFHSANEIDPNAAALVVETLKRLRTVCGTAILYINHLSKNPGFRRAAIEAHIGSMRWVTPADLVVTMAAADENDDAADVTADLVKLTWAKVRWGKRPPPTWLIRRGRWFERGARL